MNGVPICEYNNTIVGADISNDANSIPWMELFKMKAAVACLLFVTDVLFGIIPLLIPIQIMRFTRTMSFINCVCGGFLLGSTLLQTLFESDKMLEQTLGKFPGAFMMFGLGYVFVMFFEKWVTVITTEYRDINNGIADEPGSWILRSRTDITRSNNVTAYVLVASCIVENFISTFAVGAQIDAGSLWTVAIMLISSEWIQMFIFVFQFQQCKQGMQLMHHKETALTTFGLESASNDTASALALLNRHPTYDSRREMRHIKRDTFINVVIIAATNSLGIFIGNIFTQMALGSNRNIQVLTAGLLLAFVAGIFMHLATSQMIGPEFESGLESERVLLVKGCLIVVGIVASSLLNVVVTMYL